MAESDSKSEESHSSPDESGKAAKKTGVFKFGSSDQIVVMFEGREICRYASIGDFVNAHVDGILGLERKQEELLQSQYTTVNK